MLCIPHPDVVQYASYLNSVKLSTLNQLTLSCRRVKQGQRAGHAVFHALNRDVELREHPCWANLYG